MQNLNFKMTEPCESRKGNGGRGVKYVLERVQHRLFQSSRRHPPPPHLGSIPPSHPNLNVHPGATWLKLQFSVISVVIPPPAVNFKPISHPDKIPLPLKYFYPASRQCSCHPACSRLQFYSHPIIPHPAKTYAGSH